MKKQNHSQKTLRIYFAVLTIILIFLFVSNIFSQVIINERVEINPALGKKPNEVRNDSCHTWILGECELQACATEVDLITRSISPGETIQIGHYNWLPPAWLLQESFSIEPQSGELSRIGIGTYLFTAPDTLTTDTLFITIDFDIEYYSCWQDKMGNNELPQSVEQLDCPCFPYGLALAWAFSDEQIVITWDSLDVKVVPDTIYPGDTAQVVIKKRLPDGTLIDFDSTQTYEVGMLDGCILGNIKTNSDSGYYVYNVTQPIYFIADTSADTTGAVLLRVGLVEQTNKPQNKSSKQKEMVESDCFYGWQSDSYYDVTEFVDKRLEIIYPVPDTTEWITVEPQMPTVICKAKLKNYDGGTVKFSWEYWVSSDFKRYNKKSDGTTYPICPRISKSVFLGYSYAQNDEITNWEVPFLVDSGYFYFKAIWDKLDKNHPHPAYSCDSSYTEYEGGNEVFTGGLVWVKVTAYDMQGRRLGVDTLSCGKLLGQNQTNLEAVYSYVNSNEIKAILIHESRTKQFETTNTRFPKYEVGWPRYGYPNGYGLMQIDNSPAPVEEQLWNWKSNIDGGKNRFESAKYAVMKYINNNNAIYVDSIFYMNAFQNYNSNKRYWLWNDDWYYVPVMFWVWKKQIGWMKNPNRPKNNYGKIVYNIYKGLN